MDNAVIMVDGIIRNPIQLVLVERITRSPVTQCLRMEVTLTFSSLELRHSEL